MPTKIEWTHPPGYKGETWNPVTGCTKISPACAHCYAEAITLRFKWGGPFLPGKTTITCHEDRLAIPLHWRAARCIFTCSMSDLFHEDVPTTFIRRVIIHMAITPQHLYLVLTKRPERMLEVLADNQLVDAITKLGLSWPLSNVWLGTSVENQVWADRRIPVLLEAPAVLHFLSVEPLLKEVNLLPWLDPLGHLDSMYRHQISKGMFNEHQVGSLHQTTVRWVIVGGESGPRHRPMDPDWVRVARDQCAAHRVPFFLKQWGGAYPGGEALLDGQQYHEWPPTPRTQPVGGGR